MTMAHVCVLYAGTLQVPLYRYSRRTECSYAQVSVKAYLVTLVSLAYREFPVIVGFIPTVPQLASVSRALLYGLDREGSVMR